MRLGALDDIIPALTSGACRRGIVPEARVAPAAECAFTGLQPVAPRIAAVRQLPRYSTFSAGVIFGSRVPDARPACAFRLAPGWRWICLACLLLALHGRGAETGNSTVNAHSLDAPYSITELAYTEEGMLRALPAEYPGRLTQLIYGEPVTNLVFKLNGPEDPEPPPHAPRAVQGPPARPRRPLLHLDRWGQEHGLPANKVRSLCRTRDGYLWVGTVGGLARFDGVRFTILTETNCIEMKRDGSIARAMIEDEQGRLWIGTERGLLCRHRDSFVTFPGQQEIRGRLIHCLSPRAKGGFWIATDSGLACWDGHRVRWHELEDVALAGRAIHAVVESARERLWLGGEFGLLEIDARNGRTVQSNQSVWGKETQLSRITNLHLDRSQRLWLSGIAGTWRWDLDDPGSVPVFLSGVSDQVAFNMCRFAEAADGVVWLANGRNQSLFCFADGRLETSAIVNLPETMEHAMCMVVDQENTIWVGSRVGLFRLRRLPVTSVSLNATGASASLGNLTETPSGGLWFSGTDYCAHWTEKDLTRLWFRFLINPVLRHRILCAEGHNVWGAGHAGIYLLAHSSNSLVQYPGLQPRFLDLGSVKAMIAAKSGGLWIASSNGLHRTKDFITMERIHDLPLLDIRVLAEDTQFNLWIGTDQQGLYQWNRQGWREITLEQGLRANRIRSLHVSGDDTLWIGTAAGLCRYRANKLLSFGPDSGVPQATIYSVVEDDQQQLWLNSPLGLSRVARRELESWLDDPSRLPAVAHYGVQDGLLSLEVERGSVSGLKARDGRLWFLKGPELCVVDPAELPPPAPAPRVFIESVFVDGQAYPASAPLKLPPGAGHTMDVWFTATSLHSPAKVLLRYQLAGHEQGWREAGSIRRATYTNLRPGRYEFRARARNHEGRWSERDAVLSVEVTPVFWQTPLFFGAGGVLMASLVTGLVAWRLRHQRARLQAEQRRRLELERRRIARDLHDHLGAHLASVGLTSDGQDAARSQSSQPLRELNELIWSVHPENDNLPSLADFIASFSARFLSAAGLELDLDLPASLPETPLPGLYRQEVAALVKESLRNIVQHAQARRVTIRLRVEQGTLHLLIRDDGKGFSPGHGSGHGLSNLQARSVALDGACQIISSPGHGAEIQFSLPLPR